MAYENRREGDRIIQDANQPIRSNRFSVYAYAPDTFPTASPALIAPLTPPKPEAKVDAPLPPRAPRADATPTAATKAHAEALETDLVPMPQARPKSAPARRASHRRNVRR